MVILAASSLVWLAGCGGRADHKGDSADALSSLNAGGSTFLGPMMKKWATVYYREKGVELDYALDGSGNGIQQMIARTYDFGCTDAPMNEEQLQEAQDKGGAVLHLPLVMGPVVPIYNVPELKGLKTPLKFNGPVLADIFLGTIDTWNHDSLKKLNPGVTLPERKIVVVRRAEPSGTTFIWTSYLARVSPEWQDKVSKEGRVEVQWPTGVGKQGNDGVVGHVLKAEGALGYVEMIYAQKNQVPYGAVENRDHQYIHAQLENVEAAGRAAEADLPDSLIPNLIDRPGANVYPICGTVYAVLYQNQPPPTGRAVVDFLRWATHEGQRYAAGLHYAHLPEGLARRISQKLDSVKMVP